MDQSISSMSSSIFSLPSDVSENSYNLALKFFLNKNFEKSYSIISILYDNSFEQLSSGQIDLSLFNKVQVFYFTHIGMALDNTEGRSKIILEMSDKELIVDSMKSDTPIKHLLEVFGTINDIPTELIYNIFLVYYICSISKLISIAEVERRFEVAYHTLESSSMTGDRHYKSFVELMVLKVLPDCMKYDNALYVIKSNPLFVETSSEMVKKLEKERSTRENKELERQKVSDALRKAEEDKKEAKIAKAKDKSKVQNLNYRTISEIKRSMNNGGIVDDEKHSKAHTAHSAKNYLATLYSLLRVHISKSAISYATFLILVICISRKARLGRGNLMQKLTETIKMAVRVTYL